ncbi:tetratricopeptide repeat protein [Streptomyces sp. NBC_00989]|uniref:tetratricopeptide repeat protein n=1 Tax=Streptomyces sp. NBC_00989 TaxID=2903705 RepID=UPI003865F13E|nr:hypothetical protein OG714_08775 [Streptomyces sp. NBC_00989]
MTKRMALWGEELFRSREWERRRGLAPESHAELGPAPRGFEPCLLAVLRLSLGTKPDTRVPTGWFRQALARTGYLARAAESAYTISDEAERGEELLTLVKAAANTEDLCGAQELAESITVRQLRDLALVALVPAWARAGERDRAVAVAESVRYPHNWGKAWALLAEAAADDGDTLDALEFADRADAEASSAGFDGTGEVLVRLVKVADAAGDQVRAAMLADRVEDFARSHKRSPWTQPGPLAVVLAREALRGDLDRVDALLGRRLGTGSGSWGESGGGGEGRAGSGSGGGGQAGAGSRVGGGGQAGAGNGSRVGGRGQTGAGNGSRVGGRGQTGAGNGSGERSLDGGDPVDQNMARHGDADPDMLIRYLPVPSSPLGASDLAHVLDAVAESAAQEVALTLADRAETLLDTTVGFDHDLLLSALTLLLARRGQVERAMALADRIDSPAARAGQQAAIVGQLARYGDTDRAEALASEITDRRARTRALIEVVRELARRGDPDRAETLARSITDRWAEGEALIAVVRELARRGDPERAEALAHSIAYRATRARALAVLAELSDPPRARRLAAQVMVLDDWATALPLLERLVPRAVATVAHHAEELLRDRA